MIRTKQPMKALYTITRAVLVGGIAVVLAACSGRDLSAPTTDLAPRDANKALVGAVDGVYTYLVNPSTSNTLSFGKSYLSLPAYSICDLETSGYGSQYWNSSCAAETSPVTITATVRNALSNNPSIDFQPAMRFNPTKTVNLFIYVTNSATLSNMTVMKYCGPWSCVDESLTDQSLKTNIDWSQNLVWRRIKHFSGYLIAE